MTHIAFTAMSQGLGGRVFLSAPKHWSHSQLEMIFNCGEQYRLEKVAKVPRVPAWWFVSGTAFHQASEDFDRDLFNGSEPTEEQALDLFDVAWGKEYERNKAIEPDETLWMRGGRATKSAPNKEDGEFLYEQGRLWIVNYRTWRLEHPNLVPYELPDGEPAIEVEYSIPIADQIIRGGIDRVFVDLTTGLPIVVDHKTGSRQPENDDQLSEYAHAFEVLFGVKVEYGAYYMAREGSLTVPLPLTLSLAEFEKKVRGATIMRDNKVYVPHKTNRCKTCPVRRYCAAVGGADAHLYAGVDE